MKSKRTRKLASALRRLFSKWTAEDSREANIDNRYSAEILPSVAVKLEAAADALRQIERLTIDDNYPMDIVDQKTINKIAQDAWRAAQK